VAFGFDSSKDQGAGPAASHKPQNSSALDPFGGCAGVVAPGSGTELAFCLSARSSSNRWGLESNASLQPVES
jgi:hypothetical protein